MKKRQLEAALFLGLIAAASMAEINLENTGSAGELITTTSPTSLTLSGFNAGAGNYVVVAVATMLKTTTGNPVTSVTFGGTTLDKIGEEFVDDTYEGWTILYGAAASGTGDVRVDYTAPVDNGFDSVAFSVASYSGIGGVASVSAGVNDPGDPGSLTDSITTTTNNTLIICSVMLGGPEVFSQSGSTVIVRESGTDRIDSALLSLDAPTAAVYSPASSFTTANRAAMISAELTTGAAVNKGVIFVVQ